jgi:hypothetical protein
MKLTYDSEWIEGIVFLASRRMPAPLRARYERQRVRAYDAADRDAAFFALHLKWFRELALEQRLLDAVKKFPLIQHNAATLLVRKAVTRKDEGAELFVRPDAKNVALAMRCERWFEPDFDSWLAHELTHISDMLDPAFAYEPEIRLPDAPPAELELLRERYRVLWDVTIDGRLNQNKPVRLAEFQKVMPGSDAFERLWKRRPSHPELVALAKSVLVRAERTPGAPCPLCKFPTFAWAENPPVEAIRRDFPAWLPEHGCCARCAELYSMQPQPQPATLYVE